MGGLSGSYSGCQGTEDSLVRHDAFCWQCESRRTVRVSLMTVGRTSPWVKFAALMTWLGTTWYSRICTHQ